jgi:hypothetical protein
MDRGEALRWWQTRWFVAFCTILAAVPLIWPDVPPLVDLPGHMGRYRVQLEYTQHPWLAEWYDFKWSLMGNLGVDLLVIPFAKFFGLELGVKLIVLSIPPMTVAGFLWIAREVHGRIPATALFALPLAYAFPFHFGFVNFALSMAFAMLAFGLWLRLGRLGKLKLRAILFLPISALIWLTHTFGWGTLGLLAFSAELIRQHDIRPRREGGWRQDFVTAWIVPWFKAGIQCLVLAPPVILMLAWRSGGNVSGQTFDWFNWMAKSRWVVQVFRDRWQLFDIASVGVLFLLLFKAVRDPNIQYSRNLTLSALFLLAVYILLPRVVFGSAYADMRLVPFMIAVAILAIRPKPGMSIVGASVVAILGFGFYTARIAATTASFAIYDASYDRELEALKHLPTGSRLLSFVGETCYNEWTMTRLQHVPGLALERNLSYTNDQWSMAGGQLMTVKYLQDRDRLARSFTHDPSELVTDVKCPREYWRPVARALVLFPRDAFDYVWLIRPPHYDKELEAGLTPVWRGGEGSTLFRVDRRVERPDPAEVMLPMPVWERQMPVPTEYEQLVNSMAPQ